MIFVRAESPCHWELLLSDQHLWKQNWILSLSCFFHYFKFAHAKRHSNGKTLILTENLRKKKILTLHFSGQYSFATMKLFYYLASEADAVSNIIG